MVLLPKTRDVTENPVDNDFCHFVGVFETMDLCTQAFVTENAICFRILRIRGLVKCY